MSTILIGVDASARSEDAIAFGRRLADASSARVVVACAFPYSDAPSRASNAAYRQALADDAEQTARDMRDRLDGIAADRLRITDHAQPLARARPPRPRATPSTPSSSSSARLTPAGWAASPRAAPASGSCTARRAPWRSSRTATARAPSSRSAGSASPTTAPTRPTAAVAAAVELARALDAELEIIGVVAPRVLQRPRHDGRRRLP